MSGSVRSSTFVKDVTQINFFSMATKQTRRVKLHSKFRKMPTSFFDMSTGKEVPWLNVSGEWLRKAGFNAGDAVEITVANKMLIIKNAGHGNTKH